MVSREPCVDRSLERRYVATVAMMSDLLDGQALSPLDIADRQCAVVYQALLSLKRAGKTVDVFTVLPELVAQGRCRDAGGEAFVRSLLSEAPVDARAAVEQLRELGRARRLREHLLRAISACEEGRVDAARVDVVRAAEYSVEADPSDRFATAHEAAAYAWEQLVEREVDETRMTRLGIPSLDRSVGRVSPGSLVVLGARPGVGKSSIVYTMASEMAARGKRPGIVAVEDRRDVWGARVLGELSGVNPTRFRDRTHSAGERERGKRALDMSMGLNIHFAFEVRSHVSRVLDSMERLVKQRGCDVLMVDYLQRIRGPRAESQRVMFGDIAGEIKDLAGHLDVPLVLASQLRRPERGEGSEPNMTDLKETGDIEEMADAIILLWRKGGATMIDAKVEKLKWAPGGLRFRLQRGAQGTLREATPGEDNRTGDPDPDDFADDVPAPQRGIDWDERAREAAGGAS